MELLRPTKAHLAGYAEALQRGWSPDTLRPGSVALPHRTFDEALFDLGVRFHEVEVDAERPDLEAHEQGEEGDDDVHGAAWEVDA